MKSHDIGYLRENLREAMKDLPFAVVYRGEVLGLVVDPLKWILKPLPEPEKKVKKKRG